MWVTHSVGRVHSRAGHRHKLDTGGGRLLEVIPLSQDDQIRTASACRVANRIMVIGYRPRRPESIMLPISKIYADGR